MSTTYALRRGRELNPRMAVLQTAALPLRHHAFLLFVGVLPGHCPPGRNRTYDRLLKRQLLYRLSYERKRMNEYIRINLKINYRVGFGHDRIVAFAPCVPTRTRRQNSRTSNFVNRLRLSRPTPGKKQNSETLSRLGKCFSARSGTRTHKPCGKRF